MKYIVALSLIALNLTLVSSTICEKYQNKIRDSDVTQHYTEVLDCVVKMTQQIVTMKTVTDIQKMIQKSYDVKFQCFETIKNPSAEIVNYFQCMKNYYEAKYDTTIEVAFLEDQKKGTDSLNWGDEELAAKIDKEFEARKEPTNIALYIFCLVLGVAIISLVIAIIYSRYKISLARESENGLTNLEFGSSQSKYQKQTDS